MTLHKALIIRGNYLNILAFLDLKKAYDRVSHGAIVYKLNKLGIGGRFLRAITSMY